MTDSPPPRSDSQSPLDRVLDVAVYAPVGLALAAKHSLPKWVEAGRRQLGAQLTLARTIGRLAVDQGSRQAGGVLRRLAEDAEAALVALGLVPGDDDLDDEAAETAPTDVPPSPAPSANGPAPTTGASTTGTSTSASRTSASGPSATAGTDRPSGLDPAELAIPGYDTLSASQIVQRLPGLSPEQLEAVRLYELAGRSRKTVLLRVAQLKGGS